jgi:hypothetical protein
MMNTYYSTKGTSEEAVAEIAANVRNKPRMILFFTSTRYDLDKIGKGLEVAFPKTVVIGCTTAGELVSGQMLKGSVVAAFFDDDLLSSVEVEVIHDLASKMAVAEAFSSFEKKVGKKMASLDPLRYAGLILIDGLRMAEERIMDAIGNISDLTWIGGSAGDDLKFTETRVFANGKSMTNAAVLALLRLDHGFDIIKTQSFRPTPKKLVATEVDEATRMVISFDKRPAIQAYASSLGMTVEKATESFMRYPFGLMVDGEPFVRSPQRRDGDKMVFFCQIKEGMELVILESQNIVKDTAAAVQSKLDSIGPVKGIINFNCILRTLELDAKGEAGAYGKVFSGVPTVGFSTYGEEYIGHINQTATMLLLK